MDYLDPFNAARRENNEMGMMPRLTVGIFVAELILMALACGADETPLPTSDLPVTTLEEVLASPDRYNGKEILLEGFYFQCWESNFITERMAASGFAEGHLWPFGPKVWIQGSIPKEVYVGLHQLDMMGPLERYGKVRIKGKFQTGERYGHLGQFDARIIPSGVQVLQWSSPLRHQ